MRTLSAERIELIDALVAEANIGDITAGLLEKDEHLTAALQVVFGLGYGINVQVGAEETTSVDASGSVVILWWYEALFLFFRLPFCQCISK